MALCGARRKYGSKLRSFCLAAEVACRVSVYLLYDPRLCSHARGVRVMRCEIPRDVCLSCGATQTAAAISW